MPTVTEDITIGTDDAENEGATFFLATGFVLQVGTNEEGDVISGHRYQTVNVPKSAVIDEAVWSPDITFTFGASVFTPNCR